MKHTIRTCRSKFDISNMKQTSDFLKDKGNCYRDSQEANQALENQLEVLFTEVTTEVWRRDDQVQASAVPPNLTSPLEGLPFKLPLEGGLQGCLEGEGGLKGGGEEHEGEALKGYPSSPP